MDGLTTSWIVVGARRSVHTRFVMHIEYDGKKNTSSAEVALDVDNTRRFDRCYHPGIALERFEFLEAKSPRDMETPSDIKPLDVIRSLYRQNRPLDIDFLRAYGPGAAYFFPQDKGPIVPTKGDTPKLRLEYSPNPTFYVAVGPVYAVRQLSRTEALDAAHDPRLSPPALGPRHQSYVT
jgi:hypothetical protein